MSNFRENNTGKGKLAKSYKTYKRTQKSNIANMHVVENSMCIYHVCKVASVVVNR